MFSTESCPSVNPRCIPKQAGGLTWGGLLVAAVVGWLGGEVGGEEGELPCSPFTAFGRTADLCFLYLPLTHGHT